MTNAAKNILFIMFDQLRWDYLGCAGHPHLKTPTIDALAAEGVTEDFKSLPPGKQNFAVRRIDEAAKPETRDKRIREAVEAAHRRREERIDKAE